MTVAIGLVCTDGVIVASDSLGQSGKIAISCNKVKTLESFPLVWTAAGNLYVVEEVETNVEEVFGIWKRSEWQEDFEHPNLSNARAIVSRAFFAPMHKSYDTILPGYRPPDGEGHPFKTDFLVLWMSKNGPHFIEIDGTGLLNSCTGRIFQAIGTGGEFACVAHAMLKHHFSDGRLSLEKSKLIAFHIIDTVCDVFARDVRGPVQMAIATATDARVVDANELEEIRHSVHVWRENEKSVLLELE